MIRYLYHFLLSLLFLLIFLKPQISAQDFVRLGKVGEWNSNYGDFRAMDVKEIRGVTYAFCATSRGMAVFCINFENNEQNRTKPEVSFISLVPLGCCTDIVIGESGRNEKDLYAYITVGDKGLYIRNVTDPAFSYHVGICDTPGDTKGLAISGDYAFVTDGENGLQIIDISNKQGPVIVSTCNTHGSARGVAISGDYAFVADEDSGLQIINISNKKGPVIIGNCDTPGDASGIAISDDYAFVADSGRGLQIIDISNKQGPVIVGTCYTPDMWLSDNAYRVAISGDYAFVADGYFVGLQVIDISNKEGPVIIGNCDTPGDANGVILSGDYAFVTDGESGLQIIDISNKQGPVIIGNCETPGDAYGVALSGDYAFVADSGSGLQIIDISNKQDPVISGACITPGDAWGVAISGDYAFVADGESGLQIIDISNKQDPVIISKCDTPDWAQGISIAGDYAFVADGESGLQVIDISNKEAPVIIGACDTPVIASGIAISGDYAFVADGGGLQVINISDKEVPMIVGACNTPGYATGVAITEGYAFVADGESGLQVIDISNEEAPVIISSCDTSLYYGFLSGVAISGDYAFAAYGWENMQVIDLSNKEDPVIVSSCNTTGYGYGVSISGDYAFVADGHRGLQVIDLSNIKGPVIVYSCSIPGSTEKVAIAGDYAFVANGEIGLQIIDINNIKSPVIVGACDTPGYANGVVLSGNYAFVADEEIGLHVIDINDIKAPVIVDTCAGFGIVNEFTISGDYAFVADGYWDLLFIIDIINRNSPMFFVTCDTPGGAGGVAISGDYAFVADYERGLQIIDISNKEVPVIAGICDTPGSARRVAISGDYAFVADYEMGLQIINISNKEVPVIVGACDTPVGAHEIAISGNYAFVSYSTGGPDYESGLQVIDISNKEGPIIVGSCATCGHVAISGEYALVAAGGAGLQKLKINIGPPPEEKGNLILVAGGNINYKSLSYSSISQQQTNTLIRKRETSLDFPDQDTSYWQITQALANHVFNAFQNSGYEVYDIYYFNPEPLQDTDNDGIFNQLVVDDPYPTRERLMNCIRQFPEDHLANNGPLYVYLLGHAAQDSFLITPNQVISARDLKSAISEFQENTHRQVVVIIESAASGTFINDLAGPDITVITSTDDGASYIKPDFSDTDTVPYNSFTKAFMDALGPSLDPNNIPEGEPETLNSRINDLLKEAFIQARNQLKEWSLAGQPFTDQAPQMALPETQLTALSFSEDEVNPISHLFINSFQDIPYEINIIGYDLNNTPIPISPEMAFFSSDPAILDPENTEDMQIIPDPYGLGIPWYSVTPKKNGRISLIAYPKEETDPHHLLSARITIEVSIDDPSYFKDKNRMAIIVAGYHGTGDYLWESTNHIANHAYKTLLAMGYTRQEIRYYSPYYLQDPDENGIYDDIDGYPKSEIFAPDTDPNSPYAAFSKIHNQNDPNTKIKELFLFLVDHGTRETFCLNPTRSLDADYLIDNIEAVTEKVSDKIIFLYDACYSGSFLDKIRMRTQQNSSLSEKLITITSTDPNQIAYYLNQGIISFSYPFFDEWYLTHSLYQAFEYARESLPQFGESADSLKGQAPDIFDPNTVRLWDLDNIYYTDEARPVIDHVQAYRHEGSLYLSANVFSLTGIKEVWAIVESANNTLTSSYGKAVTEATELYLNLDANHPSSNYGGKYILSTPDPCPTEATYTINIYARDKSRMPKTAFYKTGIGYHMENKTRVLILATDPDLFPDTDERERFYSQLDRAKKVLKKKMDPSGIIDIYTLEDLREHLDPNNNPLSFGQNLFIYIFGKTEFQEDNPYFRLNTDEVLSLDDLFPRLPRDPNQRVLILMDTPYARQFLSSYNPQTWHENWAGIGSTNQGELFFPIYRSYNSIYGGYHSKRFPCFSNFFFSMVYSGATVAQANRMAQNAVSLTQQQPKVFLKKEAQTEYDINLQLNYYLGTSAIHGEDYSLFTDCGARVENNRLRLSLTAHPKIEENDFTAWVILKSSPSSIYQATDIAYLSPDPNRLSSQNQGISETGEENISGHVYNEDILYNPQFCKALFMVEGRRDFDASSFTEYREITIVHPESTIMEDEYEPDDDPNLILSNPNHQLLVNHLPTIRTFFCPDPIGCEDKDWVYFYGIEGHAYEIYAMDLSEYGYFINLTLIDPKGIVHSDDNYLSFECPKTGLCLLCGRLASSYPAEGVEYLLSVYDPQAQYTGGIWGMVQAPNWKGLNGLRVVLTRPNYYREDITRNGGYYHIIDVDAYSDDSVVYSLNVYPLNNSNSLIEIQVKSPRPNELKEIPIILPDHSAVPLIYEQEAEKYRGTLRIQIALGTAWFPPGGEHDPNLPQDKDFDGDGLTNLEEVVFYGSSPLLPTIHIPLSTGMNLFYASCVTHLPVLIGKDISGIEYYYHTPQKVWKNSNNPNEPKIKPNQFNAIYVPEPSALYLDLTEDASAPVLCLRGFWDATHPEIRFSNSPSCIDKELFDPACFCTNSLTRKLLEDPNLNMIHAILHKNHHKTSWESTYRFFGKPVGKDIDITPFEILYVMKDEGETD